MTPSPPLKRFASVASALVLGLFLAIGCGVDHSPIAQDSDPLTPAEEGQAMLSFSDGVEAAKKGKREATTAGPLTTSAVIGEDGGRLRVEDKGDRGGKDDLVVTLTVPEDALDDDDGDDDDGDEGVLITMTVYGRYLSELVVAFTPSGLEFEEDAHLHIRLGKDLVDLDLKKLKGQHTHADGSSEEVEAKGKMKGGTANIHVKVPGFSRYGVGGGRR